MTVETRTKIMMAAADAFLNEGYDVSIRDIRTRAGVSNGSFFHVFKTKFELACTIALESGEQRYERIRYALLASDEVVGYPALKAAISAYLQWAEENPDAVRLQLMLPSSPLPPAEDVMGDTPIAREMNAIQTWAAALIEQGAIKAFPAVLLHAVIFGPAELIVRRWLKDRSAACPARMAEALSESAWKALATDPVVAGKQPRGRAGYPLPADPAVALETRVDSQYAFSLGNLGTSPDQAHKIAAKRPRKPQARPR